MVVVSAAACTLVSENACLAGPDVIARDIIIVEVTIVM
jgi:hypothetical protein